MTKRHWESIVRRWNNLCSDLCREHNTIGTRLSENTEEWNLRDMVAEADYELSTYFEDGHVNGEMRYGDEYERKAWRSETGKLRRFIEHYRKESENYIEYVRHCSKYDNKL